MNPGSLVRRLLAFAAIGVAAAGLHADEVTDAARAMDWDGRALEICRPEDATFRIYMVAQADWLERRVVRMPLRVITPDQAEVKAGTVVMDPIVLVPGPASTSPLLIAEVSRPTFRSFVVRITVREGGPEMLTRRFDDQFICQWLSRQEFNQEGLAVRVFVELGPETPASVDPTIERPPAPGPPRKRRLWPFGKRENP